ncbi:MAG TPA: porin family protein [Ginsengibacter sp.]|nr:porin family protein [Ginsengibacter sp.]
MKKLNLLLLCIIPCLMYAQVGIKAGLNFANVTNASSINSSHSSGFMVAVFLAPPSKGIISYNTEIGFSRQGYNYATNENTGKVTLDYIMLPQLMGINISKFFTLQLGFQTAFLLNAKADSAKNQSSSNPYSSVLDYYNRFDYGIAVGFEIHPVSGLVIGARYNLSLGDLYKNVSEIDPGETPSFVPDVDAKKNVVQIFAGWRFIKNKKEKK